MEGENMAKVIINVTREGYATDQVRSTLTIGELIEYLAQFDSDAKVYTSHDNGYTYGGIKWSDIDEDFDDDEE